MLLGATTVLMLAVPVVALAAPVTLGGEVKTPLTLDEATLSALPATTIDISFQSGSSIETGTYTGVLLWDLVGKAGLVNADGKNTQLRHTLIVSATDDYVVAIAEGEFDPMFGNRQVLLAYKSADGKTDFDHLRLLVPGDIHGGRAVRDIVSIEVK
jgi:hypothetical protein